MLVMLAATAHASSSMSITYDVVLPGSSLDSVFLSDENNIAVNCGTNCLEAAVAVTAASVTFDAATGVLSNVTIELGGTGVLNMNGLNGYSQVTFSDTSFQSLNIFPSVLTANSGGFSGSIDGTVTSTVMLSFAGGVAPDAGPFPYSDAAGPSVAVVVGILPSGDMVLRMTGVELGTFSDIQASNPDLIAKGDFEVVLAAAPSAPIPEPSAALLFGMGIVAVGARQRRRRRS